MRGRLEDLFGRVSTAGRGSEGLIKLRLGASLILHFNKRAETDGTDRSICFIGGKKFKDSVVFVACAKTGYALAAVNVKNPHRRAIESRDARQKIAKGLSFLEIAYAETAV